MLFDRACAHRLSIALAAGACAALALVSSAAPRSSAPGPLHIHSLTGSVQKMGTWTSGGTSFGLLGVRLKATVCFRTAKEAENTYPSEIRITHYAVSKSGSRWWPARAVVDRAPWLVSFGENWNGKACGIVHLDDPIPPDHYGVESLGNPRNCYGVGLTIRTRAAQATRRAVITCRFGK
jgi:hypothetical protein